MTVSTTLRQPEGVAIVGMSGRFPGARDLREFWRNLCAGVESIVFFSDQELQSAGVPNEVLSDPNYVKAAARLTDIEWFDAGFFGYSAREAATMDPQQRVFLECAWEALEEAGYAPDTYNGSIAVYAGSGANSYLTAYSHRLGTLEGDVLAAFLGNAADFLSTRVSYKLNLTGPSLTVQTACSTSLVAVHLACQSLLHGECDMTLAGGVSIKVTDTPGYFFQQGGIASPDGHCRAFDARAQGTLFGDGVGVVALKRVEEAIADGDHIYAVIRGSAINNDGASKVGYTAPSVNGQARVISEALAIAGVEPETIGYIETHGTGTALGDPVEIAALTHVFRAATDRKRFCAIGSVKTNIGHLDAAAGIAGLIKTALMMHYRKLPPSLHFEQPNPEIDFANSPFVVNTALRDWEGGNGPRRSGVSSFGMGGANVHIVVEEEPAPAVLPASAERPLHLLALSAKTESALLAMAGRFAQYFDAHPEAVLADVCFTANAGRTHFPHRLAMVIRSAAEAREKLTEVVAGRHPVQVTRGITASATTEVAFLFVDEKEECCQLWRDLYDTQPLFRAAFDRCASWQSALFSLQYALAELWQSWGVRPLAVVGKGVGEYVAACVAGVLTLDDAVRLGGSSDASQLLASRRTYASPRKPFLSSADDVGALKARGVELLAIPSMTPTENPWTQILSTLAYLYARGVAVDWIGFDRVYRRRRVSLPTYPFERSRHWIDVEQRRPSYDAAAEQVFPTRGPTREELLQAAPSARLDLLMAYLRGEIAVVLGLESPEAVDPQRGFFDMGMESLTALALRSRLEKGIGCALPTTFAMNYPTVEALGNYIGSQALALELASPPAVESYGAGAADAMLAELEGLSEAELAAMIDQQVNQVLSKGEES